MMDFATVAPRLAALGYQPVPIRPGYKAPMVAGWQEPRAPESYLPYRHPRTGMVTDCSDWGVGILTAACPAVDIDVRHEGCVRSLLCMAYEMLAASGCRVGSPPKALLTFHAPAPFDKLAGRWWALLGDDWSTSGYSPHRVEILGNGQQFVSYGLHPGTGRPYEWHGAEPLARHCDELPKLTEQRAAWFMAATESFFHRIGATPLRRCPEGWQVDDGRPVSRPTPSVARSGDDDRRWQQMEPGDLAKAIDARHARRIRGGWITACPAHRSEGARSLSIMPRNGGGSIVHCFAECRFEDIADAINSLIR
jgi:hypothetical protein